MVSKCLLCSYIRGLCGTRFTHHSTKTAGPENLQNTPDKEENSDMQTWRTYYILINQEHRHLQLTILKTD